MGLARQNTVNRDLQPPRLARAAPTPDAGRRVARRAILLGLGTGATGWLMAACGAEPAPGTASTPTPPPSEPPAASAILTPEPSALPIVTAPPTLTPAPAPVAAVVTRAVTVAAPRPTRSAVAPVTPSPAPTPSPTPAPRPTDTPTATPTPTPEPLRSPLTGLTVSAEVAAQRIVAVKIDNAPGARPHSGLSEAGVVYEHVTEGSVTRYTAFFQASRLPKVGPVRSARLVDRDLVQQFDALFAHVGGSPPVRDDLRESPVADMDQFFFDETRPYFRSSDRPSPFNMYVDLAALREAGAVRHPDRRDVAGFAFTGDEAAAGPVQRIRVPGGGPLFRSDYTYDADSHTWRRSLAGALDVDAATGRAVTPTNVIVLRVPTRLTEFQEDSLGNRSLWIGTTGEGDASVFRDGRRLDGRWRRDTPQSATMFMSTSGDPIELRPGLSWVHLLAEGEPYTSS